MAHYPECRMLAIIGSGETSPTMVTVHRDLVPEPLIALRAALRGERNFAAADAIREALAATGLDVSDTPEGTRWQPTETV